MHGLAHGFDKLLRLTPANIFHGQGMSALPQHFFAGLYNLQSHIVYFGVMSIEETPEAHAAQPDGG